MPEIVPLPLHAQTIVNRNEKFKAGASGVLNSTQLAVELLLKTGRILKRHRFFHRNKPAGKFIHHKILF